MGLAARQVKMKLKIKKAFKKYDKDWSFEHSCYVYKYNFLLKEHFIYSPTDIGIWLCEHLEWRWVIETS